MTNEKFGELIKDKRILVTGGTGSIGRIIVKNLLKYQPRVIRILSRDTTKQIALQEELADSINIRYILGDIRDSERILMACEDIDIIFHAAAFKYVPQGEYNPFETVQTNVIGTQNLITAALKTPSVSRFIMISTDKAVQPSSTVGASKLLAERLVCAAQYVQGSKSKVFTTVRFGNVLGTAGSVVPFFIKRIRQGDPLVVTHPDMTRFFMTINDAVQLVFAAVVHAQGGEIFVLKMPAVAIKDLAEVCVERYGDKPVPVTYGAIRAGENITEALLNPAEIPNALETDTHFIIAPSVNVPGFPAYHYPGARPLQSQAYHSDTVRRLSKEEIAALLNRAEIPFPSVGTASVSASYSQP